MSNQDRHTAGETSSAAKPLPEKLPPPSVWPVTLALGITFLAWSVVTNWVMCIPGVVLVLLGAGGWFEDLRHDQLQ